MRTQTMTVSTHLPAQVSLVVRLPGVEVERAPPESVRGLNLDERVRHLSSLSFGSPRGD